VMARVLAEVEPPLYEGDCLIRVAVSQGNAFSVSVQLEFQPSSFPSVIHDPRGFSRDVCMDVAFRLMVVAMPSEPR